MYCSFTLMHCSCLMNSARGVGKKKKNKDKNAKRETQPAIQTRLKTKNNFSKNSKKRHIN